MFRFLELALHGWDLWPPVRILLDRNVVLVQGPNGSGKTTLLDAIRQLLNAPHLSSKRRLAHYLRQPNEPTLIWAVVSNIADRSGRIPFLGERITAEEVTLACALVPGAAGAPEKHFAVLPHRVTIEELAEHLLQTRDYYTPERYSRVLEKAGVTRSLMSVLAIEQGKTNSLVEMKPRELFRYIIEMLGDRPVLDRYRQARRKYDETTREVDRQAHGLLTKQAELATAKRRLQDREIWEQSDAKVRELEQRLPAAELQALLRERSELMHGIDQAQKNILDADIAIRERRAESSQLASQRLECAAAARRNAEEEQAAKTRWVNAHREEALAQKELNELQQKEKKLKELPAQDRPKIEAALAASQRAYFEAEQDLKRGEKELHAIEQRLERLRANLPNYPESVQGMLEALSQAGLATGLMADRVAVADGRYVDAAEAALGASRFALIVSPTDELHVRSLARQHRFPGPVYAGTVTRRRHDVGMLQLESDVPEWIAAWAQEVKPHEDGSLTDARGTWVTGAEERLLGGEARRQALGEAERAHGESERVVTETRTKLTTEAGRVESLKTQLAQENERQQLLRDVAKLSAAAKQVTEAGIELADATRSHETAAEQLRAADEQLRTTDAGVRAIKADIERIEREREQERQKLVDKEKRLLSIDGRKADLSTALSPELRARAERGDLDSPETIQNDLEHARNALAKLPEPPGPEIREETRHLQTNVEELERHVAARNAEAEGALQELTECRKHYLTLVESALYDYKQRVLRIARDADVKVELQLPQLRDDDKALDEAQVHAEFGFDGKRPLPMGDSSFSGGQQVIAGLMLIMGMAETDGQGFFMLDEPFAHLSLDRIDDVGRFLRTTRAQFILTAPTTLDRSQFDPASLVVVTRKKRPHEMHAPVPIIAAV